jgi:hypothetical protein
MTRPPWQRAQVHVHARFGAPKGEHLKLVPKPAFGALPDSHAPISVPQARPVKGVVHEDPIPYGDEHRDAVWTSAKILEEILGADES